MALFGNSPWLQEIQHGTNRYHINSYDNQKALEDELETPLVVKLVELDWLDKIV